MSETVVDVVFAVGAVDVGVAAVVVVDDVTVGVFVVVVGVAMAAVCAVGVVSAAVAVDALQPSPSGAASAAEPQAVHSDSLEQVPFSSVHAGRAVGPVGAPSGGDCAAV